ncbi:protein FAM185A [Dunckerocampus dactyliophorus]|uniref:protein FAM185A n=1 Tax=Dunckerocampus dactyliophorus TaxID=161453 RepID=UPI0024062F65|nr:protein FAM185A [Dunckerocampus dactyliophorus]
MFWSLAAQRGGVGLVRSLCRTASLIRRCPQRRQSFFTSSKLAQKDGELSRTLREWSLVVSPFSTVRARLGCSISVQPLDPHAFPEADRAFVTVHSGASTNCEEKDVDDFHVQYDEHGKELLVLAERDDSSLSVYISAPIKSNVVISTHGKGNIEVKNMECDICKVHTERGNCILHSVKGHQVEVRSGGDVTGVGTIHGNVDISASGGSVVHVKKLQGTTMKLSTELGDLKVKAIYAESSCISSCKGKMELGHLHGDATVKNTTGDTHIDGSNGSLKVSSQSGDIDVYVGDGGSAEMLSQEGAVCIRVPSSLRAEVDLCGASVDVSHDVTLHQLQKNTTESQTRVTGYMNTDCPVEQRLKVTTERGSVSLRTQSWFESLKLRG